MKSLIQTTGVDQASGQIRLHTLLAHASGEWIASDWPVCPTNETAHPHRMGAALSYARRYALFALVGIAGEDDLDAPDLFVESSSVISPREDTPALPTKNNNGLQRSKTVLNPSASAALRDKLVTEINGLNDADQLALWAHRRLAAKNTLITKDAEIVENIYVAVLNSNPPERIAGLEPAKASATSDDVGTVVPKSTPLMARADSQPVKPLRKTVRQRSKRHLRFVASQPCLICKGSPCDAHHLKFAQARSLSLKVSDEFTVPLCRNHHQELHRHGNEAAWWADGQIAPLEVAKRLWETTSFDQASADCVVAQREAVK